MSKPIKAYIAAPWVHKMDAAVAQDRFEKAGIVVTSHWIKLHPQDDESKDETDLAREALQDLDDVDAADILVLLNLVKSEGKATELGYAVARRKPIVLVGSREGNVFYRLPRIQRVETIEDAITLIKGQYEV